MDAAGFPQVVVTVDSVASSGVAASDAEQALDGFGRVHLHGVERPVTFPVDATWSADGAVRVSGALELEQRDYGIEPESVKGLVKVANEVDLHFDLMLRPTGIACPGAGIPLD